MTRRRTEVHQAASARTRLPSRKLCEAHRALGLSSCGQALQKTPVRGDEPAIETLGERKIDAVVDWVLQAFDELHPHGRHREAVRPPRSTGAIHSEVSQRTCA